MTRAPGGVLVVDDQELLRASLCHVIAGIPELVIVGEASSGEEALEAADQLAPRLVVMDVKMPGMGGLAAIRRLLARRPETVVVLVSVDECDSEQVLSAGAAAFIPKQRLSSRLLREVWEAARDASLPPE